MSETFRTYDESLPPSLLGGTPPPPPSTGATAGTPGTWTPDPSTPPANAAGADGVTASPATDWTIGQYVQGSTAGVGGEMNWNGTAWVAGRSAVTASKVSNWTIDEVKAFVMGNPEMLSEVEAYERDGRARGGLLKWLDDLLAEEPTP